VKRPLALLFAILALVLSTFAQHTRKAKQPPPAPDRLRVSSYMRNVGLMYLEEVHELPLYSNEMAESRRESWDKILDGMEDRITIQLSEGGRPSGDAPYFEMLKHARFAHLMSPDSLVTPLDHAWRDTDISCSSRAHATALSGILPADYYKTCDDNFSKAMQMQDDKREQEKAKVD
jgi:hypothetical protein